MSTHPILSVVQTNKSSDWTYPLGAIELFQSLARLAGCIRGRLLGQDQIRRVVEQVQLRSLNSIALWHCIFYNYPVCCNLKPKRYSMSDALNLVTTNKFSSRSGGVRLSI